MENHQPLIQPFLDYLKFEKRYSRHTIISYQTDLISFFDYLVTQYGEIPMEDITHTYIRSWLASLKDQKLTSKSINRKISSLKSFFKYQLRMGVIQKSPMGKIIAPKNEKRLPHFVSEKDVQNLFTIVEFSDDFKGASERLLLVLFYATGMRLSELINLKNTQVNFSNRSLKVLGKGNKERIIPVAPEVIGEIKSYQEKRNSEFPDNDEECLIINEKGKTLHPRRVYDMVKKYLDMVTTIEKRSPHVLRHTFATHMANNGADLNAVKEFLGHSSLAATQVYTHNTIEKLKNVYKNAHPKA